MLLNKTLASRSEREASAMKKQKDSTTLMACSNATGTHKLPLMFIGKAENPRCFKNVNKKALPVHYYSQKNAWINTDIFFLVVSQPVCSFGEKALEGTGFTC